MSIIAKTVQLFSADNFIFTDESPRIIHTQGSKFRILLQDSTEQGLKEVFVYEACNKCSDENLASNLNINVLET